MAAKKSSGRRAPSTTWSGVCRQFGGELMRMPYAEAKKALLEAFDREYATRALETGKSVSQAARLAGMERRNFARFARRASA